MLKDESINFFGRYTPVGKAAKKVIGEKVNTKCLVFNIISGKAASTLPFREYEESSSEVRAITDKL